MCRIQGIRGDVFPRQHKLEGPCSCSDTASLHLGNAGKFINNGTKLSDLQCSGDAAFLKGKNSACELGDVP